MKKCLHCLVSKDDSNFGQKYKKACSCCTKEIDRLAALGLRLCRKCGKEQSLDKYKKCRHVCKKCNVQNELLRKKEDGSMAAWRQTHQENVILTRIKGRCSQKGLAFGLELSDIIIPEFCPILGMKLQKSYIKGHPLPSSPSVDRIDSSKGYVKGNIAIISFRANRIKNDATQEELQKILDYVKTRSQASQNTPPT